MNPRYVQSLSKWVRGRVANYYTCGSMLQSLSQFTSDMKELALVQEEIVPGSVKLTENRRKEIELQGQNEETGTTSDSEIYRSKSTRASFHPTTAIHL